LVVEFAAVVGSGPRGRTQQIQIKGDNTREVSREHHSYKSQPRYFWAPPVAFSAGNNTHRYSFTTDSVSTIKSEPKSYWERLKLLLN
jgi:hypothetical protein